MQVLLIAVCVKQTPYTNYAPTEIQCSFLLDYKFDLSILPEWAIQIPSLAAMSLNASIPLSP